MNFQGDFHSIRVDNQKGHYVLVLDLTSMQNVTEKSQNAELVGELPRRELSITFPLKHVSELIVLGERKSSVSLDKFGLVGKTIQKG